MILNKVEDPRDNLAKATRYQVWKYAKENGVDFPESAPADIIRAELRRRGLRRVQVNRPELGAQNMHGGEVETVVQGNGVERDALADLTAQWQREVERESKQERRGRGASEMNELRAKAKALGIKMDRRDNTESLRAKVEAHGKDAA